MRTELDTLYLAYRQAKNAVFRELRGTGLLEFAQFEARLHARLGSLQNLLASHSWFERLNVGTVWLAPKAAEQQPESVLRHVGVHDRSGKPSALEVRVMVSPSVEFAIIEVLYLWRFGPILDGILGTAALGNRLEFKRGNITSTQHQLFEFWPNQYRRFKSEPVAVARKHLETVDGDGCVIASLDITSFFDSIEPSFLVADHFVHQLATWAHRKHVVFPVEEYVAATTSLMGAIARYRRAIATLVGFEPATGIAIGSITSRVIANLALASLDGYISSTAGLIHYARYVDDITIVATRSPGFGVGDYLARWLPLETAPASGAQVIRRSQGYRIDSELLGRAGTQLRLQTKKISLLECEGPEGVELLKGVAFDSRRVESERRVFLDPLAVRGEALAALAKLEETSAQPRVIRESDRRRLANLEISLRLLALERVAFLLDETEAAETIRRALKPMVTLFPTTPHWIERIDLVHRLLRISLLAGDTQTAQDILRYTESCWGTLSILRRRLSTLVWNGHRISRRGAFARLRQYLDRRRLESVFASYRVTTAGAATLRLTINEAELTTAQLTEGALSFAAADLRTLDREDDVVDPDLRRETDHSLLLSELRQRSRLQERFAIIERFIGRCRELGDGPWITSPIAIFACTRPPSYFDVARRWLYDGERADIRPDVFDILMHVVNALRGTLYPSANTRVLGPDHIDVNLGVSTPGPACRLVLGNLLTRDEWHRVASDPVRIVSQRTFDRLCGVADVLHRADHAARSTFPAPPALLVLPELCLPRRWIRSVARHLVEMGSVSLLSGLEYQYRPSEGAVYNQVMAVFLAPLKSVSTWLWTKDHPSQRELVEVFPAGVRFPTITKARRRTVISSAFGDLSVLVCSELIEARLLAELVGRVDMVLVPAWNTDTASFDHLVQSAGLQIHAVMGIANNAQFSDCRAWAPYSLRWRRDLARLIQRFDNEVIWVDAPVGELRNAHRNGVGTDWRPLPPGVRR